MTDAESRMTYPQAAHDRRNAWRAIGKLARQVARTADGVEASTVVVLLEAVGRFEDMGQTREPSTPPNLRRAFVAGIRYGETRYGLTDESIVEEAEMRYP